MKLFIGLFTFFLSINALSGNNITGSEIVLTNESLQVPVENYLFFEDKSTAKTIEDIISDDQPITSRRVLAERRGLVIHFRPSGSVLQ